MKRILISLIFLLGLSVISNSFGIASAQVCKINDANDSVEVFSCLLSGNTVIVTLSNDSENTNANVTVEVEVSYGNGGKKTFTGKIKSTPGSVKLEIPIDAKHGGWEPKSVQVISISGTKCI